MPLSARIQCVIVFCLLPLLCTAEFTSDFAVELKGDEDNIVADLVAASHGFDIVRQLTPLGNVFHFRHKKACSENSDVTRCKRDVGEVLSMLLKDPNVLRAEHQEVLEVDKRDFKEDDLVEMYRSGSLSDEDLSELYQEVKDEKLEHDLETTLKADISTYKKAIDERHKKIPKFNDPQFPMQWHLENHGQMKGINPGLDLNVAGAWHRGYAGTGVVCAVVDDGVDVTNPDLSNYDPLASTDLNDLTDAEGIPMRKHMTDKQSHGTKCAGEVGARANNKFCGVGVAYNVSLGGIRVLDGKVTDLLEAYSLLHNNQHNDIYSCSWGPKDNGFAMEMPKYYTTKALHLGTLRGRKGLGSIFVFASGNGGGANDNCGADGFVNSPYTIAAGALNIYGQSVFYGESCSAIHVAAPVGGAHSIKDRATASVLDFKVTTTDINSLNKGCTHGMSGTSAATPLVASCIALALEANPRLTWRDVQHLLARSARLPSPRSYRSWQRNAAGFLVSHHFGFGLLDCSRLVSNAQLWINVPPQVNCSDAKPFVGTRPLRIQEPITLRFRSNGCSGQLKHLEHVLVSVHFKHVRRGDIEIWLLSPSGIKSRLLGTRKRDKAKLITKQRFLSLFSWGENPTGVWTVMVKDTGKSARGLKGRKRAIRGYVTYVGMEFLGTSVEPKFVSLLAGSASHRANVSKPLSYFDQPGFPKKRPGSYWLKERELMSLFAKQRIESANIELLHPETAKFSRKLSESISKGSVLESDTAQLVSEAVDLLKREDVTATDLNFLLDQVNSHMGNSS